MSSAGATVSFDNVYETPVRIQNMKSKSKDTTEQRTNGKVWLIALTICIVVLVGLLVFCLITIIKMQNELKQMNGKLTSKSEFNALTENTRQELVGVMEKQEGLQNQSNYENIRLNASLEDLEQDIQMHNVKLNKLQLQINQSVEEISSLKYSLQQLAMAQAFPTDCTNVDLTHAKTVSATGGVFDIYPESRDKSVEVYCDMRTDGGGWIVFQRRMDGSENFYRGWNDYVNGFGDKDKEMWLGLETIYQLTKNGSYELRVDLEDFDGKGVYARYGKFTIASAADKYRLTLGGYYGTASDSMTSQNNNMQFTTKDSDNDRNSGNCAIKGKGAHWYNSCSHSNPNGIYVNQATTDVHGIYWYYWKRNYNTIKFIEMKFRKKF